MRMASLSDGDGVNAWADGNFTVNDGDFSQNHNVGLLVGAGGDLTLSDLTASENGFMGILGGAYGHTTSLRRYGQ